MYASSFVARRHCAAALILVTLSSAGCQAWHVEAVVSRRSSSRRLPSRSRSGAPEVSVTELDARGSLRYNGDLR